MPFNSGTLVTSTIKPHNISDVYPVTDMVFSIDGLRNVSDISSRNNIPTLPLPVFTVSNCSIDVSSSKRISTLSWFKKAKSAGWLSIISAKAFIYASSSSVYGDEPTLPKIESRIGNCLSPYAATKKTNE